MAKINPSLVKELKAATKSNPQQEFPFIITLKPGASLSTLENRIKVQRSFESIRAVASTMTLQKALQLAKLDAIERIEYDGEVRALKRPVKK